jgi:signal transduction histidine kinase
METFEKLNEDKNVDPFKINIKVNGDIRWLEIYISLIKVYQEKLGMQIVMRDITKEVEIEEERLTYTNNLERMVEERTNQILDNERMVTLAKISSMIAHDLKGPLQVISNSIHLIKRNPENQEKYLEYIQTAINQSNEMIEEMRSKGTKTPLKLEDINLRNVIDEALIQVKVSENVSLNTIIKTERTIRIDKLKFIRVLTNLLKNSIEAMPEGGNITIIVEEKNGFISVKVIDTGIGIPKENIENLFRPFHSTKSKGLGLGLAFCKNTIEAHRGSISVESEQGKGTTFTINLPINNEKSIENIENIENVIDQKDTLIE